MDGLDVGAYLSDLIRLIRLLLGTGELQTSFLEAVLQELNPFPVAFVHFEDMASRGLIVGWPFGGPWPNGTSRRASFGLFEAK